MNYTNTKVTLKNRPVGYPKEEDFEIINENIDHLDNGEVIIEVLWLSLDPYMRGRMSAAKSYASPLEIGEVITGGAVGKVIESKCPSFSIGDIVEGFSIGWQKFSKVKSHSIRKINPDLAPIQTAVGVLGIASPKTVLPTVCTVEPIASWATLLLALVLALPESLLIAISVNVWLFCAIR